MTKEGLASACGVSRRAVTDWEAGRVDNPPLERISQVLDFPIDFFLGEGLPELSERSVSFRALSSLGARQTRRVLSSARLAQTFSSWMDREYDTPHPDLPAISDLVPHFSVDDPDPTASATALRRLWNLSDRPIADMLALVESHGARVFSLQPGDHEVDAFSFWGEGRPYIFLNPDKSAERLRFDLAHELGHLCMHQDISTAGQKIFEVQANQFASDLLMPATGVQASIRGQLSLADVMTLKKLWKVSAAAMVKRLHQLRYISDWQYRSWFIELTKRGYRTSEPHGIAHEQSSLLKQVLAMAREDGWRLNKICNVLRLPEDELTYALAGLVVLPMQGGGAQRPRLEGHLRAV